MSKSVASTLPIGPVQAYWGDVRLGSPKSVATIRYNKDTVQSMMEDTGLNVGSHKTGETCEVDITIAALKMDELRYVYDQANQFASTPVINSSVYKSSTSTTMRFRETHVLSGTASVTLDRAGFVDGTIKVFKSDVSNTPDGYTQSTDFTATSAAGSVARLSGGSISDGDSVIIEYNQSATVSQIAAGGELADFEGTLRLTHVNDNGKQIEFYAYRAKKIGASDVAISMADAFGGIPMTFHLLADLSQPIGKQLFKWNLEA